MVISSKRVGGLKTETVAEAVGGTQPSSTLDLEDDRFSRSPTRRDDEKGIQHFGFMFWFSVDSFDTGAGANARRSSSRDDSV